MPAIQSNEDPLFPAGRRHLGQSILVAVKIANTAKIRGAFKFAFQRICPAMIRTAHLRDVSGRLGHYCGRVMAANVEEASQDAIRADD